LFESETIERWIRTLQFEAERRDTLAERLMALGTGGSSDGGEYLPIAKTAPVYPQAAADQKLEGEVIVEYTVTAAGATKNAFVVSSTAAVFDEPSLNSVSSYLYLPRVVGGAPVDVPGVRTKIVYKLE
jgi:protein TonB